MSNRSSVLARAVLIAAAVVGVVVWGNAGDLNPPAGPVAPTMKTLVEVEPRIAINATNTPGDADSVYRIAQAGSYYLTGDVTAVAGKDGIEIAANDVSIDLMGYAVRGIAGDLTSGIVTSGGALNNLTVCKGVVTGWGSRGIDLIAGGNGRGSLIESVHASDNGSIAIRCNNAGVIRACSASSNGLTGFVAFSDSIVSECTARFNQGDGFFVLNGAVVRGCSAALNAGDGFQLTDGGSTIVDCSASLNTGDGIEVDHDAYVLRCVGWANGFNGDGAGIHATGADNRIETNSVTDNDRGIHAAAAGNLIIRNSASGNGTNYEIVANNKVGVIVSAPNSGAISGSTGGAGVGTTDPWANLSY